MVLEKSAWLFAPFNRRSGELLPSRMVLIGNRVAPGILEGLTVALFCEIDEFITDLDIEELAISLRPMVAVGVLLRGGGAPLTVPFLLAG